jgi:hypothetical protein
MICLTHQTLGPSTTWPVLEFGTRANNLFKIVWHGLYFLFHSVNTDVLQVLINFYSISVGLVYTIYKI